MSQVYWTPARSDEPRKSLEAKVMALWEAAGLYRLAQANDLLAIKLAMGDDSRCREVAPGLLRVVVREASMLGAHPFLTDTAPLEASPRGHAPGHLLTAHQQGYTLAATGAPFLPADGLHGTDLVKVPIEGEIVSDVEIAAAIARADALLVVAPLRHDLTWGFAGILHQLGFECAARTGKYRIHNGLPPHVLADRCAGCGTCVQSCPRGAVVLMRGVAEIDSERCGRCGACLPLCRRGALVERWESLDEGMGERLALHAAGVLRPKARRAAFIGIGLASPSHLGSGEPSEDLGLFASWDPLALDLAFLAQAEARGQRHSTPTLQSAHAHAVRLGLGRASFRAVQV